MTTAIKISKTRGRVARRALYYLLYNFNQFISHVTKHLTKRLGNELIEMYSSPNFIMIDEYFLLQHIR